MNKPTICLAMIVKNESEVIERCLQSVLPHVNSVVIHDTGSTDDTFKKVWSLVDKYPESRGMALKHVWWADFSTNRNHVLSEAQHTGTDYILTIDADEVLVTNGNQLPELTKDLYNLRVDYAGTVYNRPALFRNDGSFFYQGKVHEYIRRKDDEFITQETVDWWRIQVYHEGARSKDPDVYLKDARLLETELARMLDTSTYDYARNLFYLAQSYRDAGKYLNALEAYKMRAALDSGWYHERWYAQFMVAKMLEKLEHHDAALKVYLETYNSDPTRPEPLYYAAMGLTGKNALREMLLRTAAEVPTPKAGLFLEPDTYEWLIPLELSVAMWYMGKKDKFLFLSHQLLNKPNIPERIKRTLDTNLTFG